MATNQSTPPDQSPRHPNGDDNAVDHADAESARIAELRAEVSDLEAELERERRNRQTVIQRYERLLDERAREADGNRNGSNDTENGSGGLLDRFRRYLRGYSSTPFSAM